VPEEQAQDAPPPLNAVKAASSSATRGPCASQPERSTASTAVMSASATWGALCRIIVRALPSPLFMKCLDRNTKFRMKIPF
jgi:hypothetical protein